MSSVVRPVASSASALPPAPVPAGWDTTVNHVLTHGAYAETQYGPTIGMESIRGPRDGNHAADYMNLWGGKLADGSFFTSYVTLVSEKWEKQPDGNFRIEQWLHLLSRDGKYDQPTHDILTETPIGIVTDIQYIREDDAAALANTTKLLDFFNHLTPKSASSANDGVSRDNGPRNAQKLMPRPRSSAGLAAPSSKGGVALR